MEWVSCKERSPKKADADEAGKVLFMDVNNILSVDDYITYRSYEYWLPIPKPKKPVTWKPLTALHLATNGPTECRLITRTAKNPCLQSSRQ